MNKLKKAKMILNISILSVIWFLSTLGSQDASRMFTMVSIPIMILMVAMMPNKRPKRKIKSKKPQTTDHSSFGLILFRLIFTLTAAYALIF